MRKRLGFVEIHLIKSSEPQPPIYFPDATSMIEFVRLWRPKTVSDQLRAHVPAHYTDLQRQELIVLPYAVGAGLTVLSYGALCRGLLSGRMTADTKFDGDDLRKVDPKFQGKRSRQF